MVTRALILPPQSLMGTIDPALRKTFIDTGAFTGVYDTPVDRESAYEFLAATMNLGRQAAPVPALVEAAPAFTAAPVPAQAQQKAAQGPTFMVYNPATGGYQTKEIPAMTPVREAPQPAASALVQSTQQSVLVLDPVTGQYVRREMTLVLDPATGQYVPVQSEEEKKAAAQAQKEQLKAQREAEKLARRQHMDDLREERAQRARKNDSILGRVQNTAISTATRTVVSQLTRGLLGGLIGKK